MVFASLRGSVCERRENPIPMGSPAGFTGCGFFFCCASVHEEEDEDGEAEKKKEDTDECDDSFDFNHDRFPVFSGVMQERFSPACIPFFFRIFAAAAVQGNECL